MKASLFKRILAYFIDIIMLSIIISIIASFVFPNENVDTLKNELTLVSDNYINGKISTKVYIDRVADINYNIDHEMIGYTIVQFIIYVVYFIIYQCKNNGQTIGKKIMGIKIIGYKDDKSLTTDSLAKRSLIANGLFFLMFSLTAILTVSRTYYYHLIIFINIIQSLVIFISCFMVLYRKDGRAIHDIIANTQVVNDKGERVIWN